MINKLLNKVLSLRINQLIQKNEYGVSLVNLPIFDLDEVCNDISTSKLVEVFIIGSRDDFSCYLDNITNANISFHYSVEEAEESRNNGNENIFRIIIIRRNDIQKMTSLEWFNKITMDVIYRLCCDYVKNNLSVNTFITSFLVALTKYDLKRLLNYEEVINFLDQMYSCETDKLQKYIDENLYKLYLCSDSHLSECSSVDAIKSRLKDNKKVINSISDLDKKERQNINNYASANPGNITPRLIIDFYKSKQKNILKNIDLEEAMQCLSAKKSSEPGPRQKYVKMSPTAFAAKLVFDNKDNNIKKLIDIVP